MLRLIVSPVPSWPMLSLPQQYAAPPAVRPQVWYQPAARLASVNAGAAAPAVAVKLTGDPVSPLPVAVAVCGPGVAPSVQIIVATPSAFVTDVGAPIEPPPVTAAQFTVTPGTTLANASVIVTLSAVGRSAPPTALCPSPPVIASVAAAAALIANGGDVGCVSAPELATSVYPALAWLSEMLLKVATPATAATVCVPESVEAPGFAPK